MDSKALALLCRELADNRKAENIAVLDVRKTSTITDYYVIASGSAEPHIRAIVDEITEELLKQHSLKPRARDGGNAQSWIVLDYFDVIVHVMRPDEREKYDLEGLWGDAPKVKPKLKRARTTGTLKTAAASPRKRSTSKATSASTEDSGPPTDA